MTSALVSRSFATLDNAAQAKLLAEWMHAATVDARDTYLPEETADPVRLRRFNELQHQIAGELVRALSGKEINEPFVQLICDWADELPAFHLRHFIELFARQSEKA